MFGNYFLISININMPDKKCLPLLDNWLGPDCGDTLWWVICIGLNAHSLTAVRHHNRVPASCLLVVYYIVFYVINNRNFENIIITFKINNRLRITAINTLLLGIGKNLLTNNVSEILTWALYGRLKSELSKT